MITCKAVGLKNQYTHVATLIYHNLTHFERFANVENASIECITRSKARALCVATGSPIMVRNHDTPVNPP